MREQSIRNAWAQWYEAFEIMESLSLRCLQNLLDTSEPILKSLRFVFSFFLMKLMYKLYFYSKV